VRRIANISAILTRSARDLASIFRVTLPRWTFTVISLTASSAATCLFRRPPVTDAMTSFSRCNGWSKSKSGLDKLSGVNNWTVHDLARTCATRLAEMSVAPHVIEWLLKLARTAYPRRTAQTWLRGCGVAGLQIPGQTPRTAVAKLANLSAQPCGCHRRGRPVRGPHHQLRVSLCLSCLPVAHGNCSTGKIFSATVLMANRAASRPRVRSGVPSRVIPRARRATNSGSC
jgi:hypothetical protein